ncbi:hypothetical protein GCM10017786_48620 [Amycolatopsis deserti]|uniref:Uncharacterized protein n=1 Tax=Amycolatopsis deserti TaxID=185696 RepID=A0ABQ3JBX3_9PSEU|nr:hypothetical protein [Amycolatopsis deserti]GHF09371.1 hypothetical protein GCM10017786_48620 [Amycolatopsis deserti]
MNPDDELGDELRRLFDDDRLAITPVPGAESTIVRGARRRRRRRTAVAASGGVLTAALLVTLGLAAARQDPGVHQAARPTTSVPAATSEAPGPVVVPPSFPELPTQPPPPVPTTTATPAPPPAGTTRTSSPSSSRPSARPEPATGVVLGPSGYRQLRLGMSFDEAKATGMLDDADTAPTECTTYRLAEGAANIASVTISPSGGVLVFAATGARTPENAGTGSTVAELRNAYPDLTAGAGNYSAATGSGASYTFYVDSTDTVVNWELVAAPGC